MNTPKTKQSRIDFCYTTAEYYRLAADDAWRDGDEHEASWCRAQRDTYLRRARQAEQDLRKGYNVSLSHDEIVSIIAALEASGRRDLPLCRDLYELIGQ